MPANQTMINEAAYTTLSSDTPADLFVHAVEDLDAAGAVDIKVIARCVSDGMMKMWIGSFCFSCVAGALEICHITNVQEVGQPDELQALSDLNLTIRADGTNLCLTVKSLPAADVDWSALVQGFSTNHVEPEA